jgi:hypothetical protein
MVYNTFKIICAMITLTGLCYGIAKEPLIYLPFDEDWVNYGSAGYGETANAYTGGDGSFPVLSDGLVGKCFDITSAQQNFGDSGCIAFPSSTATARCLENLKSVTIIIWVNASGQIHRDENDNTPLWQAVLFDRSYGDMLQCMMSSIGTPRFRVNSQWVGVGGGEADSAPLEGWYMIAFVYDSTVAPGEVTTKIYTSIPHEDQTYVESFREIQLSSQYNTVNAGPLNGSHREFIIGQRNIPGSTSLRRGMDGMLDEVRIYGSLNDGSGALSKDDILEVARATVSGNCYRYLLGDLNKDCYVDNLDLAEFAFYWLHE